MFRLNLCLRACVPACLLAMLFAFTACSDSTSLEPEASAEVNLPQPTELNQTLKTLAQATSRLVEEPEFRVWLKAEALKQFDGDYDVLWQHHLDHQFPDGQTLRAKLANALDEQYGSPKAAAEQLDRWMASYPVLQFAVPVHIEDWEAETEVIPVAYQAEDAETSAVNHIEAFQSGREHGQLSLRVDPVSPVAVVGLNERKNYVDQGEQQDQKYPTVNSARQDGDPLNLHQINIPNLNAIEFWTHGKPEFRFRVFRGDGGRYDSGIPKNEFKPARSLVNDHDDWYVMNIPILPSWDWAIYGNLLTMHWIEEDNDGDPEDEVTITHTLNDPNGSSLTFTFNISEHDDDMGSASISTSDAANSPGDVEYYRTATIRWYMDR